VRKLPRTVTLVVMGSGRGLVPCIKLAAMLRRLVRRYARVRIVMHPASINAVQVEDVGIVECVDPEVALEKLISMCAQVVKGRERIELSCAAGVIEERGS